MREWRRFTSGDRFAELYETKKGPVIVEAQVSVSGTVLRLSDLLVDAFEAPHLVIGPGEVFAIRRTLMQQARDEGYTVLELVGQRVSGANPNRPVALRKLL